jgi:hypothetical protein
MTAAKADVIVFLAHVLDAEIEQRFFKFKQECSDICDIVVLAEQGSEIPASIAPFAHFFNFSALKRMANSVIGTGTVLGNCHLRSIDFYNRFPNYRFYWFVEYDVVYTGRWSDFLSSFADDPSDLLASHVRRLADEPDWFWRESFSPGTDSFAKDEWVLAFLPVHRISRRGLEAVARKVREGWVGHFEVLLPSALSRCGLRIFDMGGSGAWTPKERVLRHYVDWRAGRHYLHGAGTLRYRPAIRTRLIKNMLYHPCKTSSSESRERQSNNRLRVAQALVRTPGFLIPYWLRLFRLAVLSRCPRVAWRYR